MAGDIETPALKPSLFDFAVALAASSATPEQLGPAWDVILELVDLIDGSPFSEIQDSALMGELRMMVEIVERRRGR